MSNNWQKAYDELKDYISKNPTIEIAPNIVCISSDVRPEFYRLFYRVLSGFLKDNFPALLEKSYVLSKKWDEASRVAVDSLKLESIDLEANTRGFLLDPLDGLMRVLIDPLFDLLKGKNDLATFEQTAASMVEDRQIAFSHEGYQSWATLSLLKLLATDKVYHVPASEVDIDPSSHVAMTVVDSIQKSVPDAVEINKISFAHSHMYSFLVPKLIGHSTSLNLFAAFFSDFDYNESRWKARMLTSERKWYGMSNITGEFGRNKLWPNMAIYISEYWKELVVVADCSRMAQPDIIVEFREDSDWYEKEGLETVKRHYNILKPKLGSFVVCLEPVSEAALKELEEKPALQPVAMGTEPVATVEGAPQPLAVVAVDEAVINPPLNIHLLSVGYDITKLEPIIEAIKGTKRAEATTGNPAPA